MCGQLLQTVSSAKYLGVTLSNDLSWHNQVCTVAQRSNSALHLIARNLHNCPKATRALAYTTLVRPKMEYCAAVWDPHLKEDEDVLERVNRRAARMVHNLGWYEQGVSPTALLSDLGWQTLATRRKHQRLHLMFNISHGLVAFPPPPVSSNTKDIPEGTVGNTKYYPPRTTKSKTLFITGLSPRGIHSQRMQSVQTL